MIEMVNECMMDVYRMNVSIAKSMIEDFGVERYSEKYYEILSECGLVEGDIGD
jgi:hypothetical protein